MAKPIIDSTKRFSSRVGNYVKYRPGYPDAIIGFLNQECGLTPAQTVADIGSGTGKLSEPFLRNGNLVMGVEPNQEMRAAGEQLLASYSRFQSITGTAEATNLKNQSVDLITVGQAFHWFDREKTRQEFLRILKPHGWVLLIWNDRNTTASPFFQAYENLLVTYATDYRSVNHKNVDATTIGNFFGAGGFKRVTFPNAQVLDFEGLKGRLLSSSYAPESGHPNHVPMLDTLRTLFDQFQANGQVTLEYDTAVYYGRLSG